MGKGNAWGQLSALGFVQYRGTYSPITGGTAHNTTVTDNAQYSFTLPFTFTYNGSSITIVRPTTNGFLTLSNSTTNVAPGASNYSPLSSTTGYLGAISAMGQDLSSIVRSEVLGTAPNRVYVCQWSSVQRWSSSILTGSGNFQIRLYETSNAIEIIYGGTTSESATATNPQIGLRGTSNTQFNNRTTTNANWLSTAAGTANTSTMSASSTSFYTSGQTFRWPGSSNGNPATFGSNAWNVYCYGEGDALGNNAWQQVNYCGWYSINSLNFDTRASQTNSTAQSWGDANSPSSASGYAGIPIIVDNHSYTFKRQGFTCGTYQINIPSHDDIGILYVDDIEVWRKADACCAARTAVWTGYLGSTSKVEFRISEGGGGSHGALEFVSLPISATVTGTNPANCGNGSISISNIQNGHRSVFQSDFSSTPVGASLSGTASIASGELTLTTATNSVVGSAILTPSYRSGAWTANYSQYIGGGSGADGMSFTYGPISGAGNGEAGWASGLVISFDTHNGSTNSQLNIYWNGAVITSSVVNPIAAPAFRTASYVPIRILVNTSNQLTVDWNSTNLLSNYALPAGYISADKSAWNFGFSARTGGANDIHKVSDVFISTIGNVEFSTNGTTWATTNPISVTSSAAGSTYNLQARPTAVSCANNIGSTVTITRPTTIGFGNLETQNGTICASTGTHTIRGRVWKDTYTNPAGADPNFEVQIGYSSSNTNPSGVGWTWSAASFFEQSGNDDRYTGNLTGLAQGTYYYSIRYRYCTDGSWYYGGYSSGGGGAYNGTTNVNGVLTVNAAPTANAGSALSNICRGTSTVAMGGGIGGGATGGIWSGGSGSWTNANSPVNAVYNAAANESGTITLTLTATAPTGCTNVTATKNLTFTAVSATPTITGPVCPGATTVSGTGVNGSSISVIRSGVSIGTATVSGGVWTATVSSVNAGESLTATQIESGKCVSDASATYTVITPAAWGEISSPASGISICGSTVTILGQVYRAGTTEAAGQGASLTADLGWSSTNTNPNTWTNWTSASFQSQQGNNDQFSANLGAGLTQGTWYYAYRYSYAGCPIYSGYGGVYGSGGSNGQATVPASQTATLSSAVGTNAQTVCKGTAITNITYTLGNGANNATLSAGSLPSGVSASVSGGVLTITGTPSSSGTFSYTYTTSGTSNCAFSFTGTITVNETLDFANLQFPNAITICQGGNANIYGQVYEPGLTEAGGAGAGITAQYGYSSANTDPSGGGWTWTNASFNTQSGNNDEYKGTFGASLAAGTYYYTMRYTYNGCTFYGGFNSGAWNGTSNVNGTLTVNAPATATAGTAISTCSNSGAVSIVTGASASNNAGTAWSSSGTGTFSATNTVSSSSYTPSAADIAAGSVTLTLTATGNTSCSNATSTKTLTITAAPTAAAGSAISTCSNLGAVSIVTGASATNNAGTAWTSSGSGTFSATNTVSSSSYTPSAADITAGSVTLTLTATGNGTCANATSSKTLTINAAPASPTASNNSRCGTGTVAISASSSGAVIDWYAASSSGAVLTTGTPNPASGTNNFTTPSIAATTIYYAEARNATTGCLSSSRTAVTATVNAIPTVTFTAQPGATACTNTDLTYTTQSGQSNYVWTFPGTLNTDYTITSGGTSSSNTVVLKYLTTGSKTVTVNYSSSGCSAVSATSSTATTMSAAPTVNAGADFNMCSGQTVAMNASTNATSTSTSASATYSAGNASTLYSASPTTATISTCPINLSVTIPVGAVITGVNVSYSMQTQGSTDPGYMSDQLSYLRCTSSGGTAESSISSGTGTTGTQSYTRNNLTIANNVTGGGTINFQLHAFRTYGGSGCGTTFNQVNNNTFTITVNYTLNPTYSWSPGTGLSATNVLNPNCSATTTTTYTLTVTGTNGCSTSDQVLATVTGSAPAAPTASTSTPQINVGGTASLSATGTSITWYNAPTAGSVLGTGESYTSAVQCTPSTVTVYAEDNNGTCASATRTAVSFTVRPMVVSNPANGLICQAGGSVTLSTQLTGGSSITWSPNTNLSTTSGASTVASPSATTVYTMSATVAGCPGSVTAQQTVGVIDAVAFTPTSTPTAVCAGNTAVLASNLNSSNFSVTSTTYAPIAEPGVGVTTLASGGVAQVALSGGDLDDGGWANIPIGFSYNYFGQTYSSLAIGTNGVLMFGTVPGYTTANGQLGQYAYSENASNCVPAGTSTGQVFPNCNNPANIIAMMANDLQLDGGSIKYWKTGIAPTQKFVVQFSGVPHYSATGVSTSTVTVQCILFETTGNVEIHIASASAGTGNNAKTVGLQNAARTIGATAPNRRAFTTAITTPEAWKFVPGADYTFQWSTAGSPIQNATLTNYTTPALNTPGTVSYSVAATNPNTQCTTTQSVNITVNALPAAPVSAGNVTECANAANQNLVVSVGAGETADWYDVTTAGSVLASGANTTSFSVPANATVTRYAQAKNTTTGCTSSTRTGVTFTTKPVPTAPTASAVSYCQGATSSAMTASAPVGSNTQNWYTVSTGGTPLAGAPTPSTATATTLTYYVSEVGTNGCESNRTSVNATINATPAAPTASNPSPYCQNASASALTATAGVGNTLYWYTVPTGGSGSTIAITPSTSTAGNTDYYVAQRSGSNCESSRATITVTVNPNITASVTNSASSTSACGGGGITFTATPTNGGTPTYQWYLEGVAVSGETGSTYTLASPADGDDIYVAMTPSAQTCLTSMAATNSNTVTLTSTASTPTVSIQSSASTAICPGTSVIFSVNSSSNMGATPSYVWKLNGDPITGETNATYTTTGLANNDQVTLEMTSSLNGLCVTQPTATSSAITTSVNTATSITSQPVATSACASGTANFSVTGAGQGTLTYQWKKNTVNITGNGTATSSSLTLSGVGAGDVADYTVVVTGACGSVTSNTAAFTLNTPTSISVHPAAVTTCTNTDANFSVTAAGQGTLSYQWTFAGTPITNATSSTYTATGVTSANAGNYRVNVTGGCGTLASNQAALTVQPATVISTQPSASTICQNNTANFSVSATGQGTLSYQWKRDGNNVGTNSSSLAVSNAQSANAGNYTVEITGGCGTTTSNAALLTVNPATSITTQPVGTAGCEGQNTTFTVVANGTGALSYQWKYGATNVGTNSASYNIPSTTTANDGNYSVVVSGGCGNATSNTVALNVYASPTTNATISTADITDATLCGKNTVAVVANSPGAESVGSWSVVGGFDITPANASATSTTFTAANSALGGAAKKLVWSHIRETSGNFCYTRDTITVDFKQPSFAAISALVEAGDVLWNGLTDANWSTSSNWYQYTVTNNVGSWIRMSTGEPSSTTKVYTLSNNAAGVCVNSSNSPALGNGETASNVYVGVDATLNLSNGSLALTGDFINNGTINPNNGIVRFTGTANQKIKGTGLISNFNNVIVDKESGTVTLEQPAQIKGTLTMTKGNIVSDETNILEIGESTSVLGSIDWTAGTVVGPIKRWFASTANSSGNSATDKASGIFPVGTSTRNRYAQINFTGNSGDGSITVEFKLGAPPSSYNLPLAYVDNGNQYIQNTDATGYWEIIPSEYGSGIDVRNYNIILRINNDAIGENPVTANPPGMRIIRAKGSNSGHSPFELLSTTASFEEYPGSLSGTDYLVSVSAVQGFSWFNVGGDNESPLPVELLSFTGFCNGGVTSLNWKTASEFNSSYYIIEKSTDGQNWRVINNQVAAGISTEELTYQFVDQNNLDDNSYYRLTQYDIDGEFTVYDPIFVSCNENGSFIKTYPNPSDASFQVLVNNPSLVGKATIQLVDTKGTIVSVKEVEVTEGTNLFYLNENMVPGIYYLSISNGTTSTEVVKHSVK